MVSLVRLALLILPSAFGFVSRIHPSSLSHHAKILKESVVEEHEIDAEPSSCPFSKAYQRYSIDMTTMEAEGRNFFASVFQAPPFMMKSNLERKYGADVVWAEKQDGLEAFATMWKQAADLSSSTESSTLFLAFPDCDKRVLINFVELMVWIEETLSSNTPTRIRASLLTDEKGEVVDPVLKLARMDEPTGDAAACLEPHELIDRRQQAWVKRMLVKLGICPFTKSTTKSGQGLLDLGVPEGKIAYHTSDATPQHIYRLMAGESNRKDLKVDSQGSLCSLVDCWLLNNSLDTWIAIHDMIAAGPSGNEGISSILLAAPEFDEDLDLWAGPIFALLETGVLAAQASSQVGVVCFHPRYATPDGTTWPGFGHMHSVPRLEAWVKSDDTDARKKKKKVKSQSPNLELSKDDVAAGGAWQRRTPHATINVLRADQLEMAESRRDTPLLYRRNIQKLMDIGNEQLMTDLRREQELDVSR